jgi:hypothetical protein
MDWLLDTCRHGLDEFDATVFTSTVLGAYAKSLRMQASARRSLPHRAHTTAVSFKELDNLIQVHELYLSS